jgi:hypothetical protein
MAVALGLSPTVMVGGVRSHPAGRSALQVWVLSSDKALVPEVT